MIHYNQIKWDILIFYVLEDAIMQPRTLKPLQLKLCIPQT